MRFLVAILYILLSCKLFSQNLVHNGSFEEYATCPEDYSQQSYTPYVKYWDSPNMGTPDYFNSCSEKCGVPLNWLGNANAFHGNAYMGIIACMYQMDPHQIAYREYIRIKLTDTLQAGKEYYASMQLRLGLSCNISCNGLGMFFANQPYNTYKKINYPFLPQIGLVNNNIITDKNKWTQVCGTFVATGGEAYVIIGNFLSNQKLKYITFDENLLKTQNTVPAAYYFIDDVKLLIYTDSLNLHCKELEAKIPDTFAGKIHRNDKLILKNLHFESDKAQILEESFYELDQLVFELRANTTYKIKIYGYTDNIGDSQYNYKLSEQRAIAVRNYLLEKGISKFRITTKGFGDTKPVSDNNTEEGKQLNRRVEIEVY